MKGLLLIEDDITNQNTNHRGGWAGKSPQLLRLMLQNVNLNPEKTCPPPEPSSDFFYWMLSYYSLELMRALIRSSSAAFSYSVTFIEAEPEKIPQIVLLQEINRAIQHQLEGTPYKSEWKSILDSSQYLRAKAVTVNPLVFQDEVEKLIQRIQEGVFEQSGDRRIYSPLRNPASL